MASGQEENIMNLLRSTIYDEPELRDVAAKLHLARIGVPMLLASSDIELEAIIRLAFPAASDGLKLAIAMAIRIRKENSTDEGAPHPKRPKLSGEFHVSMAVVLAREMYFEKLLEPPADLPLDPDDIKAFLDQIPVKLPVGRLLYERLQYSKLATFEVPEEAEILSCMLRFLLSMHNDRTMNEPTSSAYLFNLTGEFLAQLNDAAPPSRKLHMMFATLDSANPQSSQTASQPLKPLSRPDLQLFVKGFLILRWENKVNFSSRADAINENVAKAKVWSPLYYGAIPYVIGGCCAGNQFEWLQLVPNGEEIVADVISTSYDLSSLSGVAAFLHSNIRMHCLLQKLQEILTVPKLNLYSTIRRGDTATVTFYPHFVRKVLLEVDEESWTLRKALYKSIRGSKYLIQGTPQKLKKRTVLHLEPVGDPNSKPDNLKELEDATHDILCGLEDLHKSGYTHRDIRWDNCIKVNVKGNWKWILIDLESAGVDDEEWALESLKPWDDFALVKKDGKGKYRKASDTYLLGKLICEWLDGRSGGDDKAYEVMKSRAKKMRKDRLPAVEVKKEFCVQPCERCLMFGC